MTVLSLIGPSGAGKTTVWKSLNSLVKLPENYMELNYFQMDNRLIMSKWYYIGNWINRVLMQKNEGTNLLLTDRSPIDTCAYAKEGDLLFLPILETIKELKTQFDVHIKFIYLKTSLEELNKRIEHRINLEPERKKYNELEMDLTIQAFQFYESHSNLWDYSIESSYGQNQVKNEIIKILESHGWKKN